MQTETFKELDPRQVRKFLRDRGITVSWLARKTGLNQQQLHNWFAGREGLPLPSQHKIAEAIEYVTRPAPELAAS